MKKEKGNKGLWGGGSVINSLMLLSYSEKLTKHSSYTIKSSTVVLCEETKKPVEFPLLGALLPSDTVYSRRIWTTFNNQLPRYICPIVYYLQVCSSYQDPCYTNATYLH